MSDTPADTVSEAVYSALYDDDEARVCKDVPDSACQHQPRNWVFSTLSLSLTKTGDALVDPKLTLTWLLARWAPRPFWWGYSPPCARPAPSCPSFSSRQPFVSAKNANMSGRWDRSVKHWP